MIKASKATCLAEGRQPGNLTSVSKKESNMFYYSDNCVSITGGSRAVMIFYTVFSTSSTWLSWQSAFGLLLVRQNPAYKPIKISELDL